MLKVKFIAGMEYRREGNEVEESPCDFFCFVLIYGTLGDSDIFPNSLFIIKLY